jgi:hypothetical protein
MLLGNSVQIPHSYPHDPCTIEINLYYDTERSAIDAQWPVVPQDRPVAFRRRVAVR